MSGDGDGSDAPAAVAAVAAPAPKSRQYSWETVKENAKKDPVIVAFLGLTVAALTRGLYALVKNDRALSQRMMRYRVLFQLCTFGAIMGTVYHRAYTDPAAFRANQSDGPRVDKRVWMERATAFDLPPGAAPSPAAGTASDDDIAATSREQLR